MPLADVGFRALSLLPSRRQILPDPRGCTPEMQTTTVRRLASWFILGSMGRKSPRSLSRVPSVMNAVITHPDEATAEWLTAALCEDGALSRGSVSEVTTLETIRREWSCSRRLKVSYSPGSVGRRPEQLFLKIVNTLVDDEIILPSEVDYYRRDYVGVVGVPLVPCYGARYCGNSGYYYVLLDDVSATHVTYSEAAPIPIDEARGFALMEGLAIMHAHLWGSARMAAAGYQRQDPSIIDRFVGLARPGVKHIVGTWGDELLSGWPQAMRDIFVHLPGLLHARSRHAGGFTVIHGDVGPENIFFPRQGGYPTFVIDRQPFDWSLSTWLGVYDAAFAMVLYWTPQDRRQLEERMLRRYHEVLVARGVADYSLQKLTEDYRLSILTCLCVAAEWCRGGPNADTKRIWMPMLQRTMTAFDDLDCQALLRSSR